MAVIHHMETFVSEDRYYVENFRDVGVLDTIRPVDSKIEHFQLGGGPYSELRAASFFATLVAISEYLRRKHRYHSEMPKRALRALTGPTYLISKRFVISGLI